MLLELPSPLRPQLGGPSQLGGHLSFRKSFQAWLWLLGPLSQQSTVGLADPTKLAHEHIASSCRSPVALANRQHLWNHAEE